MKNNEEVALLFLTTEKIMFHMNNTPGLEGHYDYYELMEACNDARFVDAINALENADIISIKGDPYDMYVELL